METIGPDAKWMTPMQNAVGSLRTLKLSFPQKKYAMAHFDVIPSQRN